MPTPGPLATLPAPALLVLVWRVSRFVASRRSRARCACLGRALRTRRIGQEARGRTRDGISRIVYRASCAAGAECPSTRAYARSSMSMTRGPALASPVSASPPRTCLAPENARRFFATWVPPGRYAPARPSVRASSHLPSYSPACLPTGSRVRPPVRPFASRSAKCTRRTPPFLAGKFSGKL